MAILEKKVYKQEDLVLKVSDSYDPFKLPLGEWEEFLDALCGQRVYQKEAIKKAVIYLAACKYSSLIELAKANYEESVILQGKYKSFDELKDILQIPDKLYGTIDLATGTGKSYVIYGVSIIMLGLGIVDRVLVLCPSLTIENGLTEKFVELCGNAKLRRYIPTSAVHKNPRVIDANESVVGGDICIENIHAVYEATGSSIKDSFSKSGERVLVLNDEAHHIFNKPGKEDSDVKKWKDFLESPDYGFKYMLGFTGTAYIEDDYFSDVIYRYSLRTAIDEGIVKNIDYVKEDDSTSSEEKFEKIYANHRDNEITYPEIKPLTILVTRDIKTAESLRKQFIEFIVEKEKIDVKSAERKVLIVTSSPKHRVYLPLLKTVDQRENPVEWIVSVSMLTEGWDVKNVFQIVPMEERAFDSKLLVAQVLGRGLRIPEQYKTPQPKVVIFNHKSWSSKIKKLIEEVLEIETRVTSKVLNDGDRNKYHFVLENIQYQTKTKEVEASADGKTFDFSRLKKEGIALESQSLDIIKSTEYESVKAGGRPRMKEYALRLKTLTIDEVLDKLFDEFEQRDWEGRVLKLGEEEYTKNKLPPRKEIYDLIKRSMEQRGNNTEEVTEANVRRILTAFTPILRKSNKTVITKGDYVDSYTLFTKDMGNITISIAALRHSSTVFYSQNWESEKVGEDKDILKEVIEDETLPRSAVREVNPYLFKTPVDIAITSSEPERKFVEQLCREENAAVIESWIKSRDMGFYEVDYSYRYGMSDSKTRKYKQGKFNPDFFIKVTRDDTSYVLVVEIKEDGDVCEENVAKYKYALKHFDELNKKMKSRKYIFHFLSPDGYSAFFKHLQDGTILEGQSNFRCNLENEFETVIKAEEEQRLTSD